MADGPATTGGGRPRDEELTAAIVQATAGLLHEVGFDRLTIAAVAARAGCGRGAIYRRWSTKEELALAALRDAGPRAVPLGDDPRANVERMARHISNEIGNSTELIAGFIAASRDDPDLAKAMRDRLSTPDRHLLRQQITEVVGDDAAIVDFLADAIPGVALLRSLVFDEPIATDEIVLSVGEVLGATAKPDASAS
jgi:AcrR family transcriptional regulator